jgi:hypothetical protein
MSLNNREFHFWKEGGVREKVRLGLGDIER